jgi:23S rRNA (cytosine1962-C5)-methyltransferase
MDNGYALLDSGNGERLERFGDVILTRPSSLAIWKRRKPALWANSTASYSHEDGWRAGGKAPEEWPISVAGVTLTLRLQRNGQIGFFPEHALYMPELAESVARARQAGTASPQMLNLFAFTGMASMVAAKAGAHVTHIDILKPALDWAKKNAAANQLAENALRLIPEEAIIFLEREVKRNKSYSVIVLDPPGFSRIDKHQSWDLPDVLPEMIELTTKLLAPGGEIFFTSHGAEHGGVIVENLYRDLLPAAQITSQQLLIPESDSSRQLPAGFLVRINTERARS